MQVALEILSEPRTVHRHDLTRPLRIGRAPSNDLVLAHAAVSGHHAVLAQVGVHPTLTDLRSTNGTKVNGVPIDRPRRLVDGDVVSLGDQVHAVLSVRTTATRTQLVLEDRTTGLVHTQLVGLQIDGHRLDVSGVDEDGMYVCSWSEGRLRVDLDEPFQVAGRELVLRHAGLSNTTLRNGRTAYPFEVDARLDGPTGPEARFRHLVTRAEHTLAAENRAVLVYLLADRLRTDRSRDPDSGGWCDDERLRVGIWGPAARQHEANNLNVLIRRSRRELDKHGFDGGCIQKIAGHTRICVDRLGVGVLGA